MLRLSDNPRPRFPEGRSLRDDLGLWMVAHAKPRQEKALAHDLERKGRSYYLPLIEKRVRRRDNRKLRKSWLPLFPGYLAIAAGKELAEELYATGRIARLLPVAEQERFVLELEQVEKVLSSDVAVELVTRIRPGQAVRVRGGPFQGMDGKVLRKRDGSTQFVIQVLMFKQSVAVEMDESYLDPA
jgi:transcription antitermination factor NusG